MFKGCKVAKHLILSRNRKKAKCSGHSEGVNGQRPDHEAAHKTVGLVKCV